MKKIVILFTLLLSLMHVCPQNRRVDSLKLVLTTAKEDTNKVWVLNDLCRQYIWSFADTAIMYAKEQLQLSRELNFKRGEAWGLDNLSISQTTLGNYAGAVDLGYKSLAIFNKLKDTGGLIIANLDLATCYREQEDYKRAIDFFQEGLSLSRLSPKYGDTATISVLLGGVYERENKLDSALFLVKRAYEENNHWNWSALLIELGAIHAKLGHHELALDFYRKGIPSAIRDNYQVDILDAYNGMANVYAKEGKTDSAIYYASQTLAQKWGRSYPIGLLRASTLLGDIYASKNISDSTLKYLKLTIQLKDSLFNQQKTRESQNFTFNQQLHQQELQQTLQQTQLKFRNRLNIYILMAGLLILIIIAGGLWRRNIFRQKSFALLQKQKQEIDIQKTKVESTLEDLRSTQSLLIQSEKMASLGELAAGIAHEIQNPLNFVNNFSEVNKELLVEMNEEIGKGNFSEVTVIANDVIANQEKINFHGKRADSIVKGMLQHSRSSSSVKEPTDINALVDEYLRLSYHGLRAKDNSFNATLKTDYDESIGEINIIPQDIGRVILNLLNNAFYAGNQAPLPPKSASPNLPEGGKKLNYRQEPIVWVSTKNAVDKILISVRDNGNGIPSKIVDKIFQPFFTTKPTGQGTGLGLSLSYDIVKAHGGELKVESKEGEGAVFTIQLPV